MHKGQRNTAARSHHHRRRHAPTRRNRDGSPYPRRPPAAAGAGHLSHRSNVGGKRHRGSGGRDVRVSPEAERSRGVGKEGKARVGGLSSGGRRVWYGSARVLFEFLSANRAAIVARTRVKVCAPEV